VRQGTTGGDIVGDNFVIRSLAAQDYAAWRRLWTAYLDFYEETISEEIYATAFERLMSDDPNQFQGLIAEMDGKPVGIAHYLFHRFLWTVEDTCYLLDLFTEPEMRGRGVARALIEQVHQNAKSVGITGIYWQTREDNYRGRMLYDKVAVKSPFITYEKT
jgi:GNAT superfamily N-acetyltransferase